MKPMKRATPKADIEELMPLLISLWRRLQKASGPQDRLQTREFRKVVSLVIALQEGKIQNPFQDKEVLGAYLLYDWIIRYQQGLSLIQEIPIPPKKVLDISCGAAPFSLAALKHGAKEVLATHPTLLPLEIGAEIAGKMGFPLTIRPWEPLKSKIPQEGPFDLIILGHQFFNLTQEADPLLLIHELMKYLSFTGHLLIVESSLPDENRKFLKLRDLCVKAKIPIQAPCIFKGECPALKSKSVCYAQREFEKPFLIKEIQRAANIHLSSLKMSYLLLCHRQSQELPLPDENIYRVISPPVETYEGKRFYLCGKEGKRLLGTHLDLLFKEAKAFEFLKRGELISIENPLERGIGLEIVEGTKLKVEAAIGKPYFFNKNSSLKSE